MAEYPDSENEKRIALRVTCDRPTAEQSISHFTSGDVSFSRAA